jgi:glycosyltransferase involved in cell wall biosynthesis
MTPAASPHDVTVIVPCFNEEDGLPSLAAQLAEVEAAVAPNYRLRWLFVDDGSTDRTPELLASLARGRERIGVVTHAQNRGIGAALRTGIGAAETELVASIDSDFTYDARELAHMLPLLGDEVALVTASPYHPGGKVCDVPRWRLWLSRIASGLYRRTLRSQLHTFTSCFRVYRRSAVTNLPLVEDRFLGPAELLCELLIRNERVVEFPATLSSRIYGQSKMKTIRTIAQHFRLLARYARKGRQARPDRTANTLSHPLQYDTIQETP